jgi:predicted NUDIX family NTP pyrophosphohydrolase
MPRWSPRAPGIRSRTATPPTPTAQVVVGSSQQWQRLKDRGTEGLKDRESVVKKLSAGIMLYTLADSQLKVLLVHPGGPFWAKKDLGAWSIPKGEYEGGQDAREAALRELTEETGLVLDSVGLIPLDTVKQKSGKIVTAWAAEHDFDVSTLVSNTFEMAWPKGAQPREFPEVDRAEWFAPGAARRKLVAAQAEFIDRLITKLREGGHEVGPEIGPDAFDK